MKPRVAAGPDTWLSFLLDREFDRGDEPDPVPDELWDRALRGPAREFLRRPGKEIRARVVETGWLLGGGAPGARPAALPWLVEILHAGSLIIDDIEDGSVERRGAPALHGLVGVPLALNTGNWLYFWSFVLIGRLGLPEVRTVALYREASRALLRCHQGQALDLSVRAHDLPRARVRPVVDTTTRLKTGSLLELAAAAGAIAAGAEDERLLAIARFGRDLGVGLQMLDDLSGLVREDKARKADEDLRLARPTWWWAWLAEAVDEVSFAHIQGRAREVAAGADPGPLRAAIAARVIATARAQIRAHLDAILAHLDAGLACAPHRDDAALEVTRLESHYV